MCAHGRELGGVRGSGPSSQAAVVASRHTIERYLQLSDLIDAALKREDELMAICFPRSDQ